MVLSDVLSDWSLVNEAIATSGSGEISRDFTMFDNQDGGAHVAAISERCSSSDWR